MSQVYDDRICSLGEGPLWHPLRNELIWFDINAHKMLSKAQEWQFDEYVSAAGWVSRDEVLVASESKLFVFNLETGTSNDVCALEADNTVTRSNDGRADPQGGFWIGTMGKELQENAGAIYRWYKGELRQMFASITISNSICFAPDGRTAFFTDTPTRRIMRVALDQDGWPIGDPSIAVDLAQSGENPDGSVVDTDGNIWNAQYGASRVACYSPQGLLLDEVKLSASQATCPAFAGATSTLYITTAGQDLPVADHGKTFVATVNATGQIEHQVNL